jgi:hypothetical protein
MIRPFIEPSTTNLNNIRFSVSIRAYRWPIPPAIFRSQCLEFVWYRASRPEGRTMSGDGGDIGGVQGNAT